MPAFVLGFRPEEVVWYVEGLVAVVEGSAIDLTWDAVADIEGDVVGSVEDVIAKVEDGAAVLIMDANVDIESVSAD